MRRAVVVLLTPLSLRACNTPGQPTPDQIAASSAADACISRQSTSFDDGFSDPASIANAVLAACYSDIDKFNSIFISDYHLSSTNVLQFQQSREREFMQLAMLDVLRHRRAGG